VYNLCDVLFSEETDKRPTIDALSTKIQVLEAENETLKNFLKESSEKETKEKKELSEKHSREMAELADKLKKSQQRVTTLAAKNKSQEAEAEAVDKLIFRKDPFCYCLDSGFLKIYSVRGRN
jgi:RNA polymerase-binding transcription factor DksA